ncbi:MAG: VPLPA-CTERM sorting domain-containing protein [Pseudomonadota bacterium]
MRSILLAVLMATGFAGIGRAATFNLIFDLADTVSESQRAIVRDAEAYMERTIVGYRPGIEIDAVAVDLTLVDRDGPSGILASAGPTRFTDQAGYVLSTAGIVGFDKADIGRLETRGLFFDVLVHEVAHVLGFGTLWTRNDLYVRGSGRYTGTRGLAAYRAEFDPFAEFVPVELDYGSGTANSHWDETWPGGRGELMTGLINAPLFTSRTTLAAFEDLGYVLAVPATVPVPASGWLLLAGLGALAIQSRRRPRRP